MSPAKRGRRKEVDESPIVFYDGKCKVCRLTIRLVLAADTRRRLRSAALDSPDADRHLRRLSKEDRYGSFHLYSDGQVLSGSDAIGPLLELLPPLRAAGRFLDRSERAHRAIGWLYEGISRRRGLIGRLLPRVGPPPR
jgi:predicted DCC family thiol-disulfide oxidoreductase YuxK